MNELVNFKLIQCPHCSHNMCFINPRLPNYCHECGERIFQYLKSLPEKYILKEEDVWISTTIKNASS